MAKAASAPHALDASMRVAVLHGKDSYLLTEHLKRYRKALDEKFGSIEEFTFDGATASLSNVLDELRSWGLMGGHKLVVLDNADEFLRVEERRRAIERYVEEPMADASLLMRASTWRPGNLDKGIAKAGGGIIKCEPPDDDKAEDFCEKRCPKQWGVPIDREAAELLVERIGPDLARLDTELGKLAATVCDRPEPRITRKDVAEMVGVGREEQAWLIQDALLTGDPQQALTKLRDLLEVSQAPEQMVIWSMVELARKLHDAARLLSQGEPDFAVGKTLKLWGPAQALILKAARRLSPQRAEELFRTAVGIDVGIRRGVTRDVPRRLQSFTVELTDELTR
ncbi:MAG: DNA polymerase III subunit delta [Phycisphaerae bacterium]|nr:DNA polymerase III subunit delta [Phycisphaerae bacterium]